MLTVIPKGFIISREEVAKREPRNRWVVHALSDGSEFRALYNEKSHWAMVFRHHPNNDFMIYIMDLQTQAEDTEDGELELPFMTEWAIRTFLGWSEKEPIEYRT